MNKELIQITVLEIVRQARRIRDSRLRVRVEKALMSLSVRTNINDVYEAIERLIESKLISRKTILSRLNDASIEYVYNVKNEV